MSAQNPSYIDLKEPKRCKLYLTKVDRDYKTNTGFKVKSSLREG